MAQAAGAAFAENPVTALLEMKPGHEGLLRSEALVLVESMIRPRQTFAKISPCYKDKMYVFCPCQKDINGPAYPAWRYIPSSRKN
jgi:hypothetical protein